MVLVAKSTMVLGQQGQEHLSNVASMNMAAALKEHQIGIEHELQLKKLANDGTLLLQETDVVKVVVSGMIAKVREAQKQEDKALADLLVQTYGVKLADFINSETHRANYLTERQAIALLTGGEKAVEPEVVEAEFSDEGVPQDVAISANGSGKHE